MTNLRQLIKRALLPSIAGAGLLISIPAASLSLGAAELAAAQRLGCVLADDALGYLDEQQFNNRFDAAVDEFSDEQVDIIYAKALGYIDGLLFGLNGSQTAAANRRLESYSNSDACASVGPQATRRTVSI